MAWCLIPKYVDEFKADLRSGAIDPIKLATMSSQDRHTFFAGKFGEENATNINSLFESKLLLKNQIQGYKTWIKRVAGLSTQTKMDLISRIERMNKVLDPEEEQQFLEDLASTRLKVNITQDEAKKISELSKNVADLKAKTDPTKSDIALGRAKLDLVDYVNELKGQKANLLTNVAGAPRTLMTSFDLSAPLNQGWGMLSRKQFYTSFAKMFKYAVSKNAFRDLQAEIITNPNHDLAVKAGLRLTELGNKLEMREEQFMSSLLDKVPGIAQSQRAYTGFLNKLRMDVFDDLIRKAEITGEDVSFGSKSAEDIAKVVNNFTGGARVGKVEGAVPLLNSTFFSPRKIVSTLQIMNPVNYINPKISKTARIAATRNLIGSLALSAGIIGLYALLTGKDQETDPTSSDFGKIRSQNTRLDLTGGNATYINLLARLISGRIKGQSGVSRELGTGFGQTSGWDLIGQFARYKLSPNASLLVDAIVGANAIGEDKTIAQSVGDRFKPLFGSSVVELLKSDTDNKFALALASLFGAGLNTYSNVTDWNKSSGKELNQFKSKIGEKEFVKANDTFNKKYDEWINKTSKTEEFKNLSEEGKTDLITKAKEKFKQQIFDSYKFKYKKEDTKEQKEEKDTIKDILKKTSELLKVKEVMAGDGKIKKIRVEGDTVITVFEKDGKTSESYADIDKDLGVVGSTLGKLIDSLGRSLSFKEKGVSEIFGYEDKAKRIEKMKVLASQIAEYNKPSTIIKDKTPVKEKVEEIKSDNKATETPFNQTIQEVFGDEWVNATRVLKRKVGELTKGENTQLNPNADYTNTNGSIDRGLFQINSDTFKDLQRRKGSQLKKTGANTFEDLYDPIINIKVAKIIYDEGGWDRWFGAPGDVISDVEKQRRSERGIEVQD